jgi:GAF domain-containing protein
MISDRRTKAEILAENTVLGKSRAKETVRRKRAESRIADLESTINARTRELNAALEQQTATAEVLRVISRSPTDLQPVFDGILRSAVQLSGARMGGIYRFDGELMHLVGLDGATPEAAELHARRFARTPDRGFVAGRAILERGVAQMPDALSDPEFESKDFARAAGWRSSVSVPMLRDGAPIGAISVARTEIGLFSASVVGLLQTFADQAVIAIENVRLFTELEARNRDLTEALEQQTATSEILRVISSSPTDIQPVFETIARNAVRLCDATFGSVALRDGDRLTLPAAHGLEAADLETFLAPFPGRLGPDTVSGHAILKGRVVHVRDQAAESAYAGNPGQRVGTRSIVAVPMFREGSPIGAITVWRREVRPFTDSQIELLKTFADQAVIAIENVRLFKELQQKNEALTHTHAQVSEALEQQTATAEILRVISQSPTDVQPVFDAIVRNAVQLCGGIYGSVYRFEGGRIHPVAHYNWNPEALEWWQRTFPRLPSESGPMGRVIATGSVLRVADVETDPDQDFVEESRASMRARGVRSLLIVPMFRQTEVIGSIHVSHQDVGAFTNAHVELLKTFADQAVIAIENVRLFTELQASNRELTTALDTQTATSDILRVISRSQTDVQPVFDAIVVSAVRLLGGHSGVVTRIAGDQIALAALTSIDNAGDAALRALFPQSLQSEVAHAQAMRDRAPINIADAQTDPRVPEAVRANAHARGYRSWVTVPLLRHNEAVGTIAVTRRDPGGFTDDEIALLKTFADQAVIAIENARLLTELQARTQELTRSVEQLTALGDVGRAVSSSLDLDTVLTTIVGRAVQLSGADGGTIFEYDEGTEEFAPRATLNADEGQSAMLRATRLRRGEGAVGQMAVTREPLQIPDISAEGAYESRLRGALLGAGTRALLAIPLLHEDRIVGGLVVSRRTPGEFTAEVVEILKTFATQSALAIQNARLFQEIEEKSRQLEIASQHKSEFLASMSHELRTPLNAIIGFSDVLLEKMFGDINEKQTEYLQDILSSGKHLLSLINDILDLSKIEAGRMELDLSEFDLPQAIDDALMLMRERASRRGIALDRAVDERLSDIRADERKIKQVLLNLLSNAVKFTPEGGRIDVRAALVDGMAEISVTDTGVGIAPEDQEAVFEEFRQVGSAAKKVEGTGLGLALCRKFVELHGGKIRVKSQPGQGATFTFTIPVQRGE